MAVVAETLTINPVSANRPKWSNTLKQFAGDHIVGLTLKGLRS